ncbi:uncharacterized protein LTR77_008240 [Saxophila tyrrhenica]|uniref:Uncharacterized protein n=1 Tax=Saxophila tyrrhenica TaxID=1690608 RepID=A0AAV9P2R2_9PEZI|nr:hypothetical protein LTR77_008240 [Saxophila tyrrhenica]
MAAERSKRVRQAAQGQGMEETTKKIEPGFRIIIRGAQANDVKAIVNIYNHHVAHNACVPEIHQVTEADMKRRMDDVRYFKLPYLVAVKPGATIAGRKKKGQQTIQLPDEVVGFAFADLYNGTKNMYRFTAELEVYVDNKHYMKGVASCLMDKILGLMDPMFPVKGGYEIQGDEAEGIGSFQTIKNILVNMSYDSEEVAAWKDRWLTDTLGFQGRAPLMGLGVKNGKSVNLKIYHRITGEDVDPKKLPISPIFLP